MPDKLALLKRYWGHDVFRPMQEEIVDSVCQGHDTLALMPTGGGKSLCYQLPALMREGICLVVSPLVALMKDQVQQLNNRHLKAACLVAGMSPNESVAVLYNAIAGELKFLYVSPERLRQRRFIEHFRQMKVALIAVDEAHCISQWGYDFRPPYLQIADIRVYHPETPILALTATATTEVQNDIRQLLLMHDCRTFRASFLRDNLVYRVKQCGNKRATLLQMLQRQEGSSIIYVRSRRQTQEVARLLDASGISATYYHAGLPTAERDQRQQRWMTGQCRVMVATNAFGMGIDKPDVRMVIHLDIPNSLEAYFQEAGRAGRDGNRAEAVMLYDQSDLGKLEHDFGVDFPSLKYIRNAYKALGNYYKIPLGSGADSRYNFDLEEICSTYNFQVRDFYSACSFLEREGLIELPDRTETGSTVFIPIARDELYRFQVNHMAMGNLLQALIRLYPGLFMESTVVDEAKVAARCMMDTVDVVRMLSQMNEMHVIEYCPCPTKPQIVFLSERIDEKGIMLGEASYDQLKSAARRRLDAVRDYVTNDNLCRVRQLLAYFDETVGDCGRCDVCASRLLTDATEDDVLEAFKEGERYAVNDLESKLEGRGLREVRTLLRQMLDEGTLYLDDNLYLAVAANRRK
ncbi:MAG: RecQ family ATP-dependent DNA helicase [Bacteroidales bacterium]|nr:RecQ family ATP-dependent DNA helicase [Bacteroidales bacterium]